MAYPFVLRGNSFDAWKCSGGKTGALCGASPPTVDADAGAIGGYSINMDKGSYANRGLTFSGRNNLPTGPIISVWMRVKFPTTAPAGNHGLFFIGYSLGSFPTNGNFASYWDASGNIRCYHYSESGTVGINNAVIANFVPVVGTWYDLLWTFTGDNTANGLNLYIDKTPVGSLSSTQTWPSPRNNSQQLIIAPGAGFNVNACRFTIGEFGVADTLLDPETIPLVGGASGGLAGASRTAFVDADNIDASVWTPLAGDKIKINESQTQAGVVVPGTYDGSDRFSSIPEAKVENGYAYRDNSLTNNRTGTFSAACDYPATGNVLYGVSYGGGVGTYRHSSQKTTNTSDLEDLLTAVKQIMTDDLNDKITAIEAQKTAQGYPLTPGLSSVSSDAYHQQSWTDKILQHNPAILFGVEDIKVDDMAGEAISKTYKLFCEVILVDNGMTNDVHKRIARYSRALEEIFAEAFATAISTGKVKVEQVRPFAFLAALDSDDEIKVGGVTLTISMS